RELLDRGGDAVLPGRTGPGAAERAEHEVVAIRLVRGRRELGHGARVDHAAVAEAPEHRADVEPERASTRDARDAREALEPRDVELQHAFRRRAGQEEAERAFAVAERVLTGLRQPQRREGQRAALAVVREVQRTVREVEERLGGGLGGLLLGRRTLRV